MASLQLSGSLTDIPLPDIVRLLQATRRSGCLSLVMDDSRGSIFLERGDIVDSLSGPITGLDAIRHLALFNRGTFDFQDDVLGPTHGLSAYPTAELIRVLEARMQEARQIFELMPEEQEIPRYSGGAIPTDLEVNAAELAVAMKAASGTLGTAHLADELHLDLTMVRYTLARFRAYGLVEILEDKFDPWEPPFKEKAIPEPPRETETSELPPAPDGAGQPRYWRGRRIDSA